MTIEINNKRKLFISQTYYNNSINVATYDDNNEFESEYSIPAGDFVMLLNLYRYLKDNDIRNDFINPNGKEVE